MKGRNGLRVLRCSSPNRIGGSKLAAIAIAFSFDGITIKGHYKAKSPGLPLFG